MRCKNCKGWKTEMYLSPKKGKEILAMCHRCGGSGAEPTFPVVEGKTTCQKCTVVGGGHRIACPDRFRRVV